MFGKLKRMPWTGAISRDLSFRWISEGCLILRQPQGFGIGSLNPSLLIALGEGLNGVILTLRIRSPMEMDPGNMIIVSRQLALRQYSRSSNNITTHMFLSNALIGQSYLTCIKLNKVIQIPRIDTYDTLKIIKIDETALFRTHTCTPASTEGTTLLWCCLNQLDFLY